MMTVKIFDMKEGEGERERVREKERQREHKKGTTERTNFSNTLHTFMAAKERKGAR